MTNYIDRSKMVLFRLTWMRDYQGIEEIEHSNFKYVQENEQGHESYNFRVEEDGNCYGYVSISNGNNIAIENIGDVQQDSEGNEYVDNVTIILTARHHSGGMRLVGWYRNAKLFRKYQYAPKFVATERDFDEWAIYRFTASSQDVFFIPEEKRDPLLLKGLSNTWKQAVPFYIFEKDNFRSMRDKIWNFISRASTKPTKEEDGKLKRAYGRGPAESKYHKNFKYYVAEHPKEFDLSRTKSRSVEYMFPSMDEVDVCFETAKSIYVIEVKSRISLKYKDDLIRGIYQCIKYKALQEAKDKANDINREVVAILAIETSKLDQDIQTLAEKLEVEIVKLPKDAVNDWNDPESENYYKKIEKLENKYSE